MKAVKLRQYNQPAVNLQSEMSHQFDQMIIRNPNQTHFSSQNPILHDSYHVKANQGITGLNNQYNYSFCDQQEQALQHKNLNENHNLNQTPSIYQKQSPQYNSNMNNMNNMSNIHIHDYQQQTHSQLQQQQKLTFLQFKQNKKTNNLEFQDRYSFNPLHRKIQVLQKTCRKIYQFGVQEGVKNDHSRNTMMEMQKKINIIIRLLTQRQPQAMTMSSIIEQSNQLNKYLHPYGDQKKSFRDGVPINIKITNPGPSVKHFCPSSQESQEQKMDRNNYIYSKTLQKQNNQNINSMNTIHLHHKNKSQKVVPHKKNQQKLKNKYKDIVNADANKNKDRVKSENDININGTTRRNNNNSKRKIRKSSAKKNLNQAKMFYDIQAQNYLQNSLIFQAVQVPKQSKQTKNKNKSFLQSLQEKRKLIDQQLSQRLGQNSYLNLSQNNHKFFYPTLNQETKRSKNQICKQKNEFSINQLETYESQSIRQPNQYKIRQKSMWNNSQIYKIQESLKKQVKKKNPLQYYFTANFTQN